MPPTAARLRATSHCSISTAVAPGTLVEQVPQERSRDPERHVRDDVMRPGEAEAQHVGLHDIGARPQDPAQPGDAARIELHGGERVRSLREQPGEGAATRPELEDGSGWDECGDAGGDAGVGQQVLTEPGPPPTDRRVDMGDLRSC